MHTHYHYPVGLYFIFVPISSQTCINLFSFCKNGLTAVYFCSTADFDQNYVPDLRFPAVFLWFVGLIIQNAHLPNLFDPNFFFFLLRDRSLITFNVWNSRPPPPATRSVRMRSFWIWPPHTHTSPNSRTLISHLQVRGWGVSLRTLRTNLGSRRFFS
jgi:hypothetical protein